MDEKDKELNELRRALNVLTIQNADLKARLAAFEKGENKPVDAPNSKG